MIIDKDFFSYFVLCSLKPTFFPLPLKKYFMRLVRCFELKTNLVLCFCSLGNHFCRTSLNIFDNIAFQVY